MSRLERHSSRERRGATDLYLSLYQSGMFLLAVFLLGLAGGQTSGLNLDRGQTFIYAILGLWATTIVVACTVGQARFLRLRIVGDCVISLALVWWTGGVESFFLPILFANVLAASTFFGLQQALLIGTTAIVLLTGMTVGRLAGWSPADWTGLAQKGVEGRESYLVSCLVGQAIGIQIIAFLGSRLTGSLKRVLGINDLIVKSIGEGLVALDDRKRMILMNEEALRILGYPASTEWRGKHPAEVFRREEDRTIVEAFEDSVEEVCLDWKGSREREVPLFVRIRQVQCEANGRSVWVALIRDETLERRAVVAEARVRHLEELEDMAHGLAHEIRNPLGSIRGCVQEIAGGRLPKEQTNRLAGIVLRESDRLDRIVAEFMEYSRTSPVRQDRVDLQLVVEEVVESLQQNPESVGIRLSCEVRSGVPPVVIGHREFLYRLFLNLGLNAAEACSEGNAVRFTVAPDGSNWTVVVADDGPGMEPSVRSRIFNPFFTTKTREGGLGLSIVEKIVHGHGGTIDVESEPGSGTKFKIWLPGAPIEANSSVEENTLGVAV